MAVDHRSEYLVWDDCEAGSLELKTQSGDTYKMAIAVMMRGPWNHKAGGTPVAYDGEVIAFSIPDKLLNPAGTEGRTINRDDVIVGEDKVRFTVLSSQDSVKGSHWYCATVAER